ncbi:hypothetical protein O8E95_002065 [Enterobacter quasiroggenkampii]|uniref:hypothetical protein n=1 Tax=Enterobacter quasiroggenkampii TaxID=2497436 RepID=UPI002075EFBA|nr:hypothetical protein [Enterobacter quasiroggenkampii]MCM7533791.1 hypothetical protein [Enterobacter quasiroggenkampii]
MNVINKVWHFVKPYIFKYYVAFFCGGMFWMFLDVYVTKGIDASFVSAFADIALVVFAVLAFYQAKRIWVDRTKQDGYKIALDLLHDKAFKIATSNSDLYTVLRLAKVSYLKLSKDLIKDVGDSVKYCENVDAIIETLKIQIKQLDEQYDDIVLPLKKDIEQSLFKLRNMSVKFSSTTQGTLLREIFSNYIKFHNLMRKYSNLLFSLKYPLENDPETYENIDFIIERIEKIIGEIDELICLIDTIKKNNKCIVEDESSTLLDYFDFQ